MITAVWSNRAVVVDAGINEAEVESICGDVDFERVGKLPELFHHTGGWESDTMLIQKNLLKAIRMQRK